MNILFLSTWFPFPADNGSRIRVYALMKALSIKHTVTLLSFYEPDSSPDLKGLEPICRVARVTLKRPFNSKSKRALLAFFSSTPRSLADMYSPEMARMVAEELGQNSYQVIVASEVDTAVYAHSHNIPAIFEEVELTVLRPANGTGTLARFRRWLTWYKTARYYNKLVRRFSACTVVSEQEKLFLQEVAPGYPSIRIIPNGATLLDSHAVQAEPQPGSLIYTGALTYRANYDAVDYFLREIWPPIYKAVPDAALRITGRNDGVDTSLLALAPQTQLTGYLPDIRPAIANAWACVVPLRVGGGTRLKILEAMALGTPVVATSKGAEGLAVTHEKNILIADTPAEFATHTIRLLQNPELRQRLAQNARRLVEEHYNWERIGEQFVSLAEEVGNRNHP